MGSAILVNLVERHFGAVAPILLRFLDVERRSGHYKPGPLIFVRESHKGDRR